MNRNTGNSFTFRQLKAPSTERMPRRRQYRFEVLEGRTMFAGHGDFNGDGYDDLAVGSPWESVGDEFHSGAVDIIYGSANGLNSAGNRRFTQSSKGIPGEIGNAEWFGGALAIGDFNGDGFDDLAVGAPRDTIGAYKVAGSVTILYGSSNGLLAKHTQQWTQDSPGIADVVRANEQFGHSLAAGDFNLDGRDDLAIGTVNETVGTAIGAGAVHVIFGSAKGLSPAGDQFWTQDSSGVDSVAKRDEHFGSSLAAGDFNHDGALDLAIGAFQDKVAGVRRAGAVHVLFGASRRGIATSGSRGLSSSGDQLWTHDNLGITEVGDGWHGFGSSLAAADFNGDTFDDLAIGHIGNNDPSGAVYLLNGSRHKLIAPQVILDQSDLRSTDGELFRRGYALATGDFDNDGFDDLAIGAANETIDGAPVAGAAYVAYGAVHGLGTERALQRWLQGIGPSGILPDSPQNGDLFGASLGTGDYNGDGRSDLVIGAPDEALPGRHIPSHDFPTGVIHVLYAGLNGIDDANNQYWHQNLLSATNGNRTYDGFGGTLA